MAIEGAMSLSFVALTVLGCASDNPCESWCEALDDCGETADVERCKNECQLSVEAGGKDGQTDCAQIFGDMGECIDDSSCSEYKTACAAERERTNSCQ